MVRPCNVSPDLRDKPVGKKLRFDIFERDAFTCQYCGKTSAEVALECDHITPLAKGGRSTPENLITACVDCNRGKSDRHLGSIGPRPDADLMYLKTMQEIAEIERFQAAIKRRDEARLRLCEQFAEKAWALTADEWAPTDDVLLQLMDRYELDVVDYAVSVVAKRIDDGRLGTGYGWVPFIWGVAKRREQQLNQGE